MKPAANKTNAARLLEAASIRHTVREYPVDEADLSGIHTAAVLGLPAEQLFKTLVLRGERTGYFVCCIPANAELDLKKAARAAGDKACAMLPMKELLPVTGYIRGGCSPIGMKKKYPTFVDETCILWEELLVSAGRRGVMLALAPEDLLRIAEATVCDLTV